MKTNPSDDPLVDEILGRPSDEFRESMRGHALRLAGERRRGRARRRMAIIACVPIGIALAFLSITPRPVPIPTPKGPSFAIIHTHALDPAFYTTTRSPVFTVVTTSPTGATIVETATANPTFHDASDRDLLAMFPGRAVGLVHDAPGRARLLFLDDPKPMDQRE